MGHKLYTREQRKFIIDNAELLTASQIADHLGVKTRGVYSVWQRSGTSGRKKGENHHNSKLSKLQVAMITTLYDAGFTVNEIYNALFTNHPVVMSTIYECAAAITRKDG